MKDPGRKRSSARTYPSDFGRQHLSAPGLSNRGHPAFYLLLSCSIALPNFWYSTLPKKTLAPTRVREP